MNPIIFNGTMTIELNTTRNESINKYLETNFNISIGKWEKCKIPHCFVNYFTQTKYILSAVE